MIDQQKKYINIIEMYRGLPRPPKRKINTAMGRNCG